jgi:superfamily I DNA and/or RNA helicase
VLVGDHRQLPHIIDRKLAAELDAAARRGGADAPNESAMLEKSLFETLFIELRERQARDKIPRVVTLDQQFRMHPALGEFVSAEFYAPHGEAFGSPTPAAKFAHGLPRYPGPAAWLRVPIASGEEHPGQSKSRGCEAKAIVRELQALMDHDAGKPLTFGVITFYSAQVALIQEALVKAGMVELDEDGVAEVVEPYRELKKPNGRYVERLRYGTVDAFQGMEFDVVFVSMVRSNRIPGGQANWRGRYGHLMSPNRLCVAMSRQQRLLIVAGDDGMLRGADAQQAIGPLVRFHRLCEVIDAGKV